MCQCLGASAVELRPPRVLVWLESRKSMVRESRGTRGMVMVDTSWDLEQAP